MPFKYFAGPTSEMAGLCNEQCACYFCGHVSACFALDFAVCPTLKGDERRGQVGCIDCLQAGRFEFSHDTEVGVLDQSGLKHVYKDNKPAPAGFSMPALGELRRTPRIVTWQQELWLTHCNDFMTYQGTWEPEDFHRHSPTGDGKKLFLEMTDEWYQHLWDASLRPGQTKPTGWHATYYVFKCGHCGTLRGNWDCD